MYEFLVAAGSFTGFLFRLSLFRPGFRFTKFAVALFALMVYRVGYRSVFCAAVLICFVGSYHGFEFITKYR